MSTIVWILIGVAVWCVVSLFVGVLVGGFLRQGTEADEWRSPDRGNTADGAAAGDEPPTLPTPRTAAHDEGAAVERRE